MAERIPLGTDDDGVEHWCVLRSTNVMTHRQRAPYLELVMRMQARPPTFDPSADEASAWEWACATTFMLIDEWSFDHAMPNDFDLFLLALEELPIVFVDRMGLAASVFLMKDAALLDPPKPPARPRKAPADRKRPAKHKAKAKR